MSFVLGSKSSKRILVLCTTTIAILFILLFSSLYSSSTIRQSPCRLLSAVNMPSFSLNLGNKDKHLFTNFNRLTTSARHAQRNKEKILVLTPLKDASPYLDQYFKLLDETSYPNHLISLAFLVSDSSDDTLATLQSHIHAIQSRWNYRHRFDSVRIFTKDFDFDLPSSKRHQYEMQPLRRSIMARSRNWLLSAALESDTSWVAWIDVDVVEYPTSIFQDLMRADADVVVPNCLLKRDDHAFWAYDKNNWQETDESRRLQKGLDEDFVLLEGYYEFPTYRYLVCCIVLLSAVLTMYVDGRYANRCRQAVQGGIGRRGRHIYTCQGACPP